MIHSDSDTEAGALSDHLEDEPTSYLGRPKRRVSFRHFGVRYSQWGGEYKSYCYTCDYESKYGTRGKAVKSAIAHVMAVHNVDGSKER